MSHKILDVISCKWGQWLHLSEPLEMAYRDLYRRQAVKAFRINVIFISLLYLLVSAGILHLIPTADLPIWFELYSGVGLVILTAGLLSWWPRMDDCFHLYMGACSFMAVMLLVTITGIVSDPVSGQLTHAAISYAMVIVYALVGLRFLQAVAVAWLGGAAGVALAYLLGGSINWAVFSGSYLGSSMLGMCLAYYAERHGRNMISLQMRDVELEKLVGVDALTGLANRRQLDLCIEEEWRRGARDQQSLALLMIDLDCFKQYNDHFGHLRGDVCLRTLANVIERHARRPGDLAARYGGEEFVLLLPNTDMNQAKLLTERLLKDIRHTWISHAPGIGREFVSVSIGLSVAVPSAHSKPEWLLESADHAMYEAKHDGGDCYRYGALRMTAVTTQQPCQMPP